MSSRTQSARGFSYHPRDTVHLKWVLLAALVTAMAVDAASQEVRAPELHIAVSLTHRKLALFADGRPVKLYPIAVGHDSTPTPTGEFKVINRIVDPTYYHPGIVLPPGPSNPLGHRWMGLNAKGYGIHGTPDQDSIGQAASTGCIRMARADLEELFEVVRPGMTVQIVSVAEGELAEVINAADVLLFADNNTAPALADRAEGGM